MGDYINNVEMFRKFGFDSTNQWVFYDERFQQFFGYFAEYISESNILTEHEILERDELLQRQEYLELQERHSKLQELEQQNPGLLECTEAKVTLLLEETKQLEQTAEAYATLIEDMRDTKNKAHYQLSSLEDVISALSNQEKEYLNVCLNKSRQLEELQRENYKLCNEATKCFTKIQSPPLFVHQLPLDQYFLKCDSFLQYFNVFMKENFKLQDCMELDSSDVDMSEISESLESLAKSMEYYTLEYIKENAKAKVTQTLIDMLDISRIHVVSLADMERETHELELVNNHHLKVAYEALLNDLVMHVQLHTQQRMEAILYENTKLKLERALKRHESDARLARIICSALSNAELAWIAIQLDLERKRNRFVYAEQVTAEVGTCLRRINSMRQQNANVADMLNGSCATLLEPMTVMLSQHLCQNVRTETKACLYEYEKFCRLLAYSLQGMLKKKTCAHAMEQLTELNRLERILRPMVYDSPVETPMFEHVRFRMPMLKAKMNQCQVDKLLRDLRTQFQENIAERMEKDKLWRYSQLLWMWFLTEPRRVLAAIEEVKKVVAKVPALTSVKSLGGIKRK